MLEFLLAYWKLITLVLLIIVNIIINLVRRPKVIDTIIDTINSYVPTAINDAEKAIGSGNGSSKLNYAVNNVISYLEFRFNLSHSVLERYKKYIVVAIENVLSTPQKKGEKNG